MPKFSAAVEYGDSEVVVESDDFKEFHKALAAIAELHSSYQTLRGMTNRPVVPQYRTAKGKGDTQRFEYYGFVEDGGHRRSIDFGVHTDPSRAVPFFPKDDVYVPPTNQPAQEQPERETRREPRPSSAPTLTETQATQLHQAFLDNEWGGSAVRCLLDQEYGVEKGGDLLQRHFAGVLAIALDPVQRDYFASLVGPMAEEAAEYDAEVQAERTR